MSQPAQITLEGAVANIIVFVLIWISMGVALVIAIFWVFELIDRAYNFFWKVHDEEN